MIITLACLGLAGTTITDNGVVEAAFHEALGEATNNDLACFRETMGMSKLVVFRNLFHGDETAARAANQRFEQAYARSLGSVAPIPGARDTIVALRRAGVRGPSHNRLLAGNS